MGMIAALPSVNDATLFVIVQVNDPFAGRAQRAD
jgi:hypothetical protein